MQSGNPVRTSLYDSTRWRTDQSMSVKSRSVRWMEDDDSSERSSSPREELLPTVVPCS